VFFFFGLLGLCVRVVFVCGRDGEGSVFSDVLSRYIDGGFFR